MVLYILNHKDFHCKVSDYVYWDDGDFAWRSPRPRFINQRMDVWKKMIPRDEFYNKIRNYFTEFNFDDLRSDPRLSNNPGEGYKFRELISEIDPRTSKIPLPFFPSPLLSAEKNAQFIFSSPLFFSARNKAPPPKQFRVAVPLGTWYRLDVKENIWIRFPDQQQKIIEYAWRHNKDRVYLTDWIDDRYDSRKKYNNVIIFKEFGVDSRNHKLIKPGGYIVVIQIHGRFFRAPPASYTDAHSIMRKNADGKENIFGADPEDTVSFLREEGWWSWGARKADEYGLWPKEGVWRE